MTDTQEPVAVEQCDTSVAESIVRLWALCGAKEDELANYVANGLARHRQQACADLEAENARLREAVKVLRDGYADAESGLNYVLMTHGRLSGVGFDRVTDHYHEWVIMPEREGLMAGSHVLPAI